MNFPRGNPVGTPHLTRGWGQALVEPTHFLDGEPRQQNTRQAGNRGHPKDGANFSGEKFQKEDRAERTHNCARRIHGLAQTERGATMRSVDRVRHQRIAGSGAKPFGGAVGESNPEHLPP